MSSDGSRIIEGAYRAMFTAEGLRLSGGIEWHDTRRCTLAPGYYFAQGGFGWQGELCRYDGEELEEFPVDASSLEGLLHREREWRYIGLSPEGRYALLVSRLDREVDEFGFALVDMEKRAVLWEQGLYRGEFDEPGDIELSDEGMAFITQDFNLFVVDARGEVRVRWMSEETGRRYRDVAVAGDGSRWVALAEPRGGELEQQVEVYNSEGRVVFGVATTPLDWMHRVGISQNGRYIGVTDADGVRILDGEGHLLFDDRRGDPDRLWGSGVALANDGSFVYGLGSRLYYRRLE